MDPTRSRAEYVARVAKAAAERLTGTFEVSARGRWRRIHLRRGEAVWAESSEEKDLQGTDMVLEAIAAPLAWEPNAVKFEERRTLSIDALHAEVADPVPVRRALWVGVERHVDLNDVLPSVIDPAAGPVQPTMGLWSALDELAVGEPYSELPDALGSGVTVDELFTRIPDRSGILMKLLWLLECAELVMRPRAAKPRPRTDPRGRRPAAPKPDRLQAPPEPEAATPSTTVETPTVTATVSMAEAAAADNSDFSWWTTGQAAYQGKDAPEPPARLAETTPRAPTTQPGTERPSVQRHTTPSSGLPAAKASAREIADIILKNHRKRMGKDYYRFLGLPPKAPARHVERSCRQLLRRWNVYSRRADLPDAAKQQVEELLASLQLVYRTLGPADRKAEYDRRVDRGSPPVVGGIRAASTTKIEEAAAAAKARGGASSVDLLSAMRAMEAEAWDRALGILHTLRMENPSDPDVLAELGWAAFNHGGTDGDAPEEYLLLATTFDSKHQKAIEYLARIALDGGEVEAARRRLKKLTRLNPQNRWARRTLRNLPPPKDE